jgi:hypothetical protein
MLPTALAVLLLSWFILGGGSSCKWFFGSSMGRIERSSLGTSSSRGGVLVFKGAGQEDSLLKLAGGLEVTAISKLPFLGGGCWFGGLGSRFGGLWFVWVGQGRSNSFEPIFFIFPESFKDTMVTGNLCRVLGCCCQWRGKVQQDW